MLTIKTSLNAQFAVPTKPVLEALDSQFEPFPVHFMIRYERRSK
jgi:hypothetical protein